MHSDIEKSPGFALDRHETHLAPEYICPMRTRFEFNLYHIGAAAVAGGVDPTLALMGSQGWELRGIAPTGDGGLTLALQRPLDEDLPLPDGATLAATLEEPLAAPAPAELELLGHSPLL